MTLWRDWCHWWSSLNRDERRVVRVWLEDHPPHEQWIEGKIAYAFTEMPLQVLFKRRA